MAVVRVSLPAALYRCACQCGAVTNDGVRVRNRAQSKKNPIVKFIAQQIRNFKRKMALRQQNKIPVVLGDRARAVTEALESAYAQAYARWVGWREEDSFAHVSPHCFPNRVLLARAPVTQKQLKLLRFRFMEVDFSHMGNVSCTWL